MLEARWLHGLPLAAPRARRLVRHSLPYASEPREARQLSEGERKKTQQSSMGYKITESSAYSGANEECAALRKLGIDARALERDPLTPQPTEGEDGVSPGWIEIVEGPIRSVGPCGGCRYVRDSRIPDSRTEPNPALGYLEIHSVRFRRFPVRAEMGCSWPVTLRLSLVLGRDHQVTYVYPPISVEIATQKLDQPESYVPVHHQPRFSS